VNEEVRHVYVPTYHPKTALASHAAVVAVSLGQEIAGVDVEMTRAPVQTVRGTVAGRVPGLRTRVILRSRNPVDRRSVRMSDELPSTGEFELHDVGPGEYWLVAEASDESGRMRLSGSTPVVVDSNVTPNIFIRLEETADVIGEMTTTNPAGTVEELPFPLDIAVRSEDAAGQQFRGSVRGLGRFVVPDVAAGQYRLAVNAANGLGGWFIQTVSLDGQSTLDGPAVLKPGSVATARVVLTRHPATLTGKLLTRTGAATDHSYLVVVFVADSSLWAWSNPRIRGARPTADGSFRIVGLPAGDYYLGVIRDSVDARVVKSVEFLTQLASTSVRVKLTEGETTTTGLVVTGDARERN
jgi:hypothetical protein